MQPRFLTVFEKDLLGAGCASSIELLSERVFRPFFERFFFSWAKTYGPATAQMVREIVRRTGFSIGCFITRRFLMFRDSRSLF